MRFAMASWVFRSPSYDVEVLGREIGDGRAVLGEVAGQLRCAEVALPERGRLVLEAAHRLDGDDTDEQQPGGEQAERDGQAHGQSKIAEVLHGNGGSFVRERSASSSAAAQRLRVDVSADDKGHEQRDPVGDAGRQMAERAGVEPGPSVSHDPGLYRDAPPMATDVVTTVTELPESRVRVQAEVPAEEVERRVAAGRQAARPQACAFPASAPARRRRR